MILLLGKWCTLLCNNLKNHILVDPPPALPSDSVIFVNEASPQDNDPEKKDPFNPSPIDSGQGPELYPSLAPVYAMAAGALSAEEILQTVRKKAAVNISQIQPPSYMSSHFSSSHDEERISPTGGEPERFIQRC